IVADAHGRPYGVDGYREGGADAYWQHLVDLRAVRSRRDQLLDAVARSSGQQKLRAAKDALSLLQENDLLTYYQDMLAEWLESANKLDTGNAAGYGELFFEACWVVRVVKVDPKATQELTRLVAEFEEWKKKNRFKDPDRAARLHLLASLVFVKLDNEERALDYIRQALECN